MDLFDRLVDPLIGREGAYSNHPDDRGGETNWGVTKAVALEEGYSGRMRDMTRDQAKAIYRSRYWAKPNLHLVAAHSRKVAEELFDTGVNMGVEVAGRFFQRALNILNRKAADYPDLAVDGRIGPATAGAYGSLVAVRGQWNAEVAMLRALNALQGERYIAICEGREANESFAYGWLMNRVGF